MKNLRSWLAVVFFLFVVSVMVSQSAMDFFSGLSCILLIVLWFRENKTFKLFSRTGLELPFLCFALAVILSFLANWNQQTLFVPRVLELKWILQLYLFVTTLKVLRPEWKSLQRVQIFIWISALFSFATPIIGYNLVQGKEAHVDLTSSGIARVGGFFGNPMTFSHLHALFFFLLVGISLKLLEAHKKDRFWASALTVILGFSLLLSFTRGVWIGMLVGLVVTGFLFHRRWGLLILIGSIVMAAAAIFLVPSIQERAFQAFSSGSYDAERLWIWRANWQIFLDHPLFGIGYGENTPALKEYFVKVGAPPGLIIAHAHNEYLNVLAGMGIFGFVAYLWIFVKFLKETWTAYIEARSQRLEPWIQGLLLGAFGGQISFMVGSFTESNFEHSKVRYALMLVWALVIWLKWQITERRETI